MDGLLKRENERGLAHYLKLLTILKFHPDEKPIVAQLFGNDPEKFRDVVPMLMEMGFDG